MGDLCINEEITDIPSSSHQFDHPSSECCLLERHGYQIEHVAHCDAVSNTNLFVDSIGFHSSSDDIFTRLLALTMHISRQFVHFIGESYTIIDAELALLVHYHIFGILWLHLIKAVSAEDLIYQDVNGYLENSVASSPGPHSSSSSHNICRSKVEGHSLFSKYHIADTRPEIHRRRVAEVREELLVNTTYEVRTGCSQQGVPFIIQGLMLPLFGLRLAWRLALASFRRSFYCIRCAQVQVHSIMSRVRKTLCGSSDDIGWLQHTPGMAPVEDGTIRFLELLENIRNGEHTLPNSFVYMLIPGLFSNHGPLYFVGTKRFFSKMGLACHIAKIHSEASVEHNAWELKQYIEELYWGSGKRVMLLGHSKDGVDAAAALSIYSSDLKNKVAGLALVQSPYAGTPVASDILREGQIADKETRRIMELLICKIIKGDVRALEDLTYEKRRKFILRHQLPKEIPLISFHSEASITPGVLATMTHIAHTELPWLPLPNFGSKESDDVVQAGHHMPVVIPLSAAMAVCALHLQLRYGEKSDGLVTCRDAEVPGSVVVRPDRKLDHAWMVLSSRKKDPSEPDASEMCEALLTMLAEFGQIKQETDVNYVDPCSVK